MPAAPTKHAYSREEVCRLLGISDRLLRNWEKHEFVEPSDQFSFSDLLALRTVVDLRKGHVPEAQIKKAVAALRKSVQGVGNPLKELKLYSDGRKIRVQWSSGNMEPAGQLLLNFDREEISRLLSFPTAGADSEKPAQQASAKNRTRVEAERWFEKALHLEQTGAPVEQIILAYKKAVELDPTSAGAVVNLGTVYFNARALRDAERQYRRALEIDPQYALAHFNLGNLFDEKGERAKALHHYQLALGIHPSYADAHYNIALLHQASGQHLKAVRHWKAYLKLDPNSQWAGIARRELNKLRDATIVNGSRVD